MVVFNFTFINSGDGIKKPSLDSVSGGGTTPGMIDYQ